MAACLLYACEDRDKRMMIKARIKSVYGRSEGAISRKIGNIQFVATNGEKGLGNTSTLDIKAWTLFQNLSKDDRTYIETSLLEDEKRPDFMLDDIQMPPGNESISFYKRRIQSSRLRRTCLLLSGGSCEITGLKETSLLETCHVKPYSVCNPKEKTDVHNIMILCVLYHKLYDNYLMTIDSNMNIHYSPKLRDSMSPELYSRLIEPYKVLIVNDGNKPAGKYLEWHNREFERINGICIESSDVVK